MFKGKLPPRMSNEWLRCAPQWYWLANLYGGCYESLTLFRRDPISQQIPQILISAALACARDACIPWIPLNKSYPWITFFVPSHRGRSKFPIPLSTCIVSTLLFYNDDLFPCFFFTFIFFSLLMIMSVCALVLRSHLPTHPIPPQKNAPFAFEHPRPYLNFPFDMANWLCLSKASLFKFMRSDWGLVCIWSHLCSFLEDELLSHRQ